MQLVDRTGFLLTESGCTLRYSRNYKSREVPRLVASSVLSSMACDTLQMFASGHQASASQALPRRAIPSLNINRLNGKHVSSVSAERRLQRQHRVTQQAQWRRPIVCQANASPPPVIEKVDLDAKVAVVLGTQWGDEGKGKLVDILAQKYEIVARAQVGRPLAESFVLSHALARLSCSFCRICTCKPCSQSA